MRSALSILFLTSWVLSFAQQRPLQNSEHGWYLNPHGTIRVLLIFAEIEYDQNPAQDPQPGGVEHWPQGQLPTWKDDVFDPHALDVPKAVVSRYYHDISLGQYTVLGDYIDQMITIRESEHGNIRYAHGLSGVAVTEVNKMGELRTRHRLEAKDFDMWKRGGKAGQPKELGPDDPHSYDHIMVILRNSSLTHGQGSVDPGSPGKLFGHMADSQSRFGGMYGLPFEILKHEYNHLLLGGNNFHSGGGNAAQFAAHFIPMQGGWSMMGASGSSLLTASAWDRDRLGWRATDHCERINARDINGQCVNGDIDPLNGDTGIYVIRDFITSGDALRIQMPYLSDDEYPQFLWLENHQGWQLNGSPTDRFHYEWEMPCVAGIEPGIFAVMQVDREEKVGVNIYGGHADYLRAIPAGGFHDMYVRGDTVIHECLWPAKTRPLVVKDRWQNPFTGVAELELPLFDPGEGDVLLKSKHGIEPRVEERNGRYIDKGLFLGHARQAFTPKGNNKLGMATNPPLANMMTLVNTPGKALNKGLPPDNRVVHLSGISVQLLEQRQDGAIVLRVRSNDVLVDRNVRWCADSLVLHAPQQAGNNSLHLAARRTLTLDRSRTPTRINAPDTMNRERFFNSPTQFVVKAGARIQADRRATLSLQNESVMHLMEGSELALAPKARLRVDPSSRIVVHGNARLIATEKQLRRLERKGRLQRVP